jgi:transcriptional regulator with XRE-family HTH domain
MFFTLCRYIECTAELQTRRITMDDIRDRLREIRALLRLSQSKFAAKMGVKQNTYSNIELGVNPCSDRYVNLICLTFNVREEWLRTGLGDIFKPAPELPPDPVSGGGEQPLPPDAVELTTIYQELVPLNREAVLTFAETTLQAQRNTIKALEDARQGKTAHERRQENSG